MISLLFAAVLLQADPAAAQPPVSAPASSPAAEGAESDTPKGAPVGDYDFVAWCHGALTGHMALYTLVKPELGSLERPDEVAEDANNDKLQMEAGRDYLALYTHALNGVDHDHAGPLMTRRRTAQAQGAHIWNAAKAADARTRMWSWLLWDLPGRCEIAAKRLETPQGRLAALHSPAPSSNLVASDTAAAPSSIDAALTASSAPPAAEPAAPPPVEQPAPPTPTSPDAPLSTNPAGAITPAPVEPGARGPH